MQGVGALLILLVVFGAPRQLPTIIGFAGAGFDAGFGGTGLAGAGVVGAGEAGAAFCGCNGSSARWSMVTCAIAGVLSSRAERIRRVRIRGNLAGSWLWLNERAR